MTLIDKAEALLPCPFCGGEAIARHREDYSGGTFAVVECTDCVAEIAIAYSNMDDGAEELRQAIAAWNRRAAPDPALFAEVVEALRGLHHAVCGETGFAACVRLDSGKEYPWPALDEADKATRAVLAKIGGGA